MLLGVSKDRASDKSLIYVVGAIIIFGLLMLSSASSVVAYNESGDSYYIFKRQIFFLILSLIVYWFFSKTDYHRWKKYGFFMLIISIILLSLVFIPGVGKRVNGSLSWINIPGGFSLQPSEFVKITFLLYLSAWLESRKKNLTNVAQGGGSFLIVLGAIALLMMLQPDVGTLAILVLTSLLVYFVAGGSIKHILFIILVGVLALAIIAHFEPHIVERFKCVVDSNYSRQKNCYQVNQSLIAVGSGGLIGRGLGESRQKYSYLPEVSGDSIFAIIGEETGLIFSVVLVILYLLLSYRGFLIAISAPDDFGKILAIGIVSWITFQAFINIAGMINLIPMTGVPLPFISRGGSAIMASLGAVGILVNISKQTKGK